jgi:uncharacterized damage-inducible protein DinB
MSVAESYLAEFEGERQITRKFLLRLTDQHLMWKPHDKSMSAGQLALHLAVVPGQVLRMAIQDSVPIPSFNQANPQPQSVQEILEAFDASVASVRELLPQIDDARMQKTWSATKDGRTLMTMPRGAFLRMLLFSHWIQHRGQFGVYLRLLGEKVPSSYGPSADEMPEFLEAV